MGKIDKLIFRAVIPPFLIALSILTFLVFVIKISNNITYSASFDIILVISAAIMPTILIFSLPLSYLIGILIGIGGLNGESQITAIRACGVPVRRLLRPLCLLGVIVGLATAVLSVETLPKANIKIRDMRNELSLSLVPSELRPRVLNEDLSNMVFYIEDLTPDRKSWSNVFVADNTDPSEPRTILAKNGALIITDTAKQRLQLHLKNGTSYSLDPQNPGDEKIFRFFSSYDITIEMNDLSGSVPAPNASEEMNDKPVKAEEMDTLELWRRTHDTEPAGKTEALVELNQRFSLPFSVFPFVLLGLSLAVSAKKGGRTSGFALSLVIVLLFYVLFINGIRLASIEKINPWIGLWTANIILGFIGIFLLIKAERSLKTDSWLSMDRWKYGWGKLGTLFHLQRLQTRISLLDNKLVQVIGSLIRFLFPKIFDLYIARGFLVYFFWSLAACSMLFIILTLFEILDDAIRNEIPIIEIVKYFMFYMPQIFTLAVPMSILLAILINFGILEKNSEITAVKAGGWSLYRISIPIFLLASVFCVGIFVMQDYILPTANERQDRLWNKIKNRAPQTTIPMRKWILGESDRIYNYEHFDENEDSFVGLNIYEIDLNSAVLLRRIRANRARILPHGEWQLEDGWIRDYSRNQEGFRTIKTKNFHFPEQADYFEREVFQPKESSKMTYYELQSHIKYLKDSGYNAVELQVELYKKISFPLSCLIMTLLAIPFSFIIGRRGAFFGIGASIAIAMFYMLVMGFFEAMGGNGILNPFLAAWAPNILFGAAGFWMFLSIRT
ncbi:MAG: LPS export ABC transporter permease LptG [Acidobacteria bacterium]|nr:LPS export ABC transporter permease LptG [Acidobacteriota bacterium]